jgi:hypothetical protein
VIDVHDATIGNAGGSKFPRTEMESCGTGFDQSALGRPVRAGQVDVQARDRASIAALSTSQWA